MTTFNKGTIAYDRTKKIAMTKGATSKPDIMW